MKLHRYTHHVSHAARALVVVGSALAMIAAAGGAAVAGSPTLTTAQSQAQSRAQSRAHTSTADQAKTRTWHVQAGQQSRDLAIQGMAFLPQNIWIDAGDTIRWTADSAEPHTVTFLARGTTLPAFAPGDPNQLFQVPAPVGSAVPAYQPGKYYNSGMLGTIQDSFPVAASYSLSFPAVGAFTYYCLVHGMMMKGTVHVAKAGTPYPFSQGQYDLYSSLFKSLIVWDGYRLEAASRRQSNSHTVFMGADDGTAMVMRFIRQQVTVHVGDTVSFVNNGMAAPHTVTFGQEPASPFTPVNLDTASHYAGGDLSSGIVGPMETFKVTFIKAGTFNYICALHDYMGMVGTVRVLP